MARELDAADKSDQKVQIELTINGKLRELALEAANVAAVIAALEMKPDRIAVEHNGSIVRRGGWGETPVRSGDRLEIVHFVGGGCPHESPQSYRTEYVLSDVAAG